MKNCEEAREWLLVAGPESLADAASSPVAGHLEMCASCRELAKRLRSSQDELEAAYLATSPRRGAVDVAQRAMDTVHSGVPIMSINRRRRRLIAVAGMVGLAAAAALLVTIVGPSGVAPVSPATPPAVAPDSAASIAVEVPEGRNAIVFTTRNPKVSVVWIY